MNQRHWAESYIGKPWANGARGPRMFDCWGLFRHVFASKLGIDLPLYQIDTKDRVSVSRAFGKAVISKQWISVDKPEEFDAVAMGRGSTVHHVGIFVDVDGGRVLHADNPRVTAVPIDRLKTSGYSLIRLYRHADNF